jgi:hypothetical protein
MHTDLPNRAALFHTADGTAFVALTVDGLRQTWPIRSTRFGTWLRHRYYKAPGLPAERGAIGSALDLLEARAQFHAPRQDIYVRAAERDGCICLDLADQLWRAPSRSVRMAGKSLSAYGPDHSIALEDTPRIRSHIPNSQ